MELVKKRKERRKKDKRIIWYHGERKIFHPQPDRRIDTSSREVVLDIHQQINNLEVSGLALTSIRRDGRIDMAVSGDAITYPLLSAGAVEHLRELLAMIRDD